MTEEKDIQYDFRNVPPSYPVCFNTDCTKGGECLRRLAAQHVPQKRLFGPSVYPSTWADGNCPLFETDEPQRMAWGFTRLFAEVKRKDDADLRKVIKRYLGGNGNYYRYHHGERLLSPTQQEWILDLFRRYGYTEDLGFEGYVLSFNFHQ